MAGNNAYHFYHWCALDGTLQTSMRIQDEQDNAQGVYPRQ